MKNLLLAFILIISVTANCFGAYATSISIPGNTPPASVPTPLNPGQAIKKAVADFKNLSRSERRSRIKEVKKAIHKYKAERRAKDEPSTNTLLLVILAILLPPLAVYLHEGEINNKFWLSLILTLLFFLPGVIYALIVVLD